MLYDPTRTKHKVIHPMVKPSKVNFMFLINWGFFYFKIDYLSSFIWLMAWADCVFYYLPDDNILFNSKNTRKIVDIYERNSKLLIQLAV